MPILKSSISIRPSPGQPWTSNILSHAIMLPEQNMTTNDAAGAVAKLPAKVLWFTGWLLQQANKARRRLTARSELPHSD